MKKITAIFLTFAMIFALAACGSKSGGVSLGLLMLVMMITYVAPLLAELLMT